MTNLNHSPLESSRFGFNVFRGSTSQLDIEILKTIIETNKVDIAILRLPAEQNNTLHRLEKTGFPYLVADTLVYYTTDLTRYEVLDAKNADLGFVEANAAHSANLAYLVDTIFPNYTNHYASNPNFKETDIRAGYQEWALNYLKGEGKIVWFAERAGAYIGFASCSFDADNSVCEVVLNGVLPTHANQGVYTDILRFAKAYFKKRGFKTILISTQVQNYAVQKVWVREGFSIKNAYTTLHINAMLHKNIDKNGDTIQ